MKSPAEVVQHLWEKAEEHAQVPQAIFVVVNDPPGCQTETCAFKHNLATARDLVVFLRTLADSIENEDRSTLQ